MKTRSTASRLLFFIIPCLAYVAASDMEKNLKFEKASFKVTYVRGEEKIQRVRVTTNSDTVQKIGTEKFEVDAFDSVAAQASIVDNSGEYASVKQLFLRFLNKRTMEDNIYSLKKRGRDMKLDFSLHKEIRKDLSFWQHDAVYQVELIYGDLKLVKSGIWIITKDMRFTEDSEKAFKEPERGVFDFDVSVKWEALPEFEAPIPGQEKRAHAAMIAVGLFGVIVPFFVLLGTWAKMGALNISLPAKGKYAAIGLQVCVLGHVIALGMFWWQWNIVKTWRVMGGLMIPTLLCAQGFVRSEER